MKNKQELAQALSENLDRVDESLLQQAFETDTAEKFHALDGKLKRMHFPKKRPVTTFHRVASIAACLAVALAIAFGGIALAKHLSGSFGPGPTNPPPMTQPSGTTQIPDGSQLPHINLIHNQDKTLLPPFNYNWTYLDNGFSVTTNSDICHPLLSVDPLHLTYETTPVHLFLDVAPQQISVRCWDIKHQGKEDSFAQYEEIAVTKDYGHSYDFQLKPGSYIYEISLEWSDFHGSYGNVSYVFVATVANDGPASRDVTVSSGESTITTLPEFFCYGHHCIGNSMVYGDGIGAMGKLNLSGNETDISTIPVLPLDQEISIQLAEHGTLQWVEVFSQNADGKYVLLEDFAGTVEALSELPLGTWFVALNIEWKDTCIHDDSEERCYDHLFILEVSRQAEISNPHGTCGENATWEFDPATGKLTISGTGDMFDYAAADSAPWLDYQSSIEHIEVDEGIKSIGNYAFADFRKLTTVQLPNGLLHIGDYAFQNCWILKTIQIPQSVTAIGEGAFHTCRRLESISLPNGLTSLGRYAFYDCIYLHTIALPASLTELSEGTFYNCSALKAISIPANVTVIGENAFYSCNTLKEITFLGNLQEIGSYAFYYCTHLESVTFPASLTKIGDFAFNNCYMLISICLPGDLPILGDIPFKNATGQGRVMVYYSQDNKTWTNEALTQLRDRFAGTAFFKAIAFIDGKPILPGSDYPNGTCGENATWEFNTDTGTLTISGSGEMESVNSPPWDDYQEQITQIIIEDGITAIGGFRGCANLTVVHIPDSVTTLYQYAFSSCYSLKTIQLPDSISSVGQSVFRSCTSLEQINIPFGLTKIGYGMFSDCRSLRSISLHDAVQAIAGDAFSGCASLESIVLPNSLTLLGTSAFNGCVNLQSVTFNENITVIPHSIFSDCTGLTEVILPESVTTIGDYAFQNCTNLQTITLGSKVESISVYAFGGCSQLQGFQISQDNPHFTAEPIGAIFNKTATEVVLMAPGYAGVYEVPEGVVSIRRWAFYNCTLSGVILPNSVTTIGQAAFNECKKLESVILSENLEVIEWYAFSYCQKLQEITFPASLKKVEGFAFAHCVNLRFAKFLGPCPEFGNGVFADVTGKLYYPPFDTEWFNLSHAIALDMEWLPYICPDGHTILIHPGKDATCTEDGITEGKSCTVCGECVWVQVVIPAKGHYYSNWEKAPETPNLYRRTCQYCGDIIEQIEDVSQYPPDSGTCGDSLTWHYADGVLTISGTGPMPYRFSGNAPWHKYWGVITTVVLPEGITYIAMYAFRGLINLKTIVIPSSVESVGTGIFSDCTALTEIRFLGDYPGLYGTFPGVPTLTFYYAADNPTWTQEIIDELIEYYGNRIQFIAVDENGDPVDP